METQKVYSDVVVQNGREEFAYGDYYRLELSAKRVEFKQLPLTLTAIHTFGTEKHVFYVRSAYVTHFVIQHSTDAEVVQNVLEAFPNLSSLVLIDSEACSLPKNHPVYNNLKNISIYHKNGTMQQMELVHDKLFRVTTLDEHGESFSQMLAYESMRDVLDVMYFVSEPDFELELLEIGDDFLLTT